VIQSREDASEDDVGPPPPPLENSEAVSAQEEPEYDPSEFEDDNDSAPEFPITHEILLKDHTKVVSALALDPSGARIVSGSHDYDCKLWDFGGMDMRCKPFKSWEPASSYHVRHLRTVLAWTPCITQFVVFQIHDLKFSNDGQQFLCISGTTQAKLFDRDGEEKYV
jgi:WD40 repeat protein